MAGFHFKWILYTYLFHSIINKLKICLTFYHTTYSNNNISDCHITLRCIIHFQSSWLKQHEGLALIIKTLLRIKCQISKMSTDIQSLLYNSISSKSQFGELKLLIHTKTRKHTHSMFHCALIILFVSFRSINILHWSNMWDIFYWTIQSWSLSVLTELSLPNRKIIKCGIKGETLLALFDCIDCTIVTG